VGGNSVVRPEAVNPPVLGMDTFSLWEFDGTDWVKRYRMGIGKWNLARWRRLVLGSDLRTVNLH